MFLIYIWSFSTIPDSQLPEVSLVYIDEVIFGSYLRLGADWQENGPCDWKDGTFSSTRPIPLLTSEQGRKPGG